jgi:nitrate reductase cytochrome c-type subunit
MRQLETLGEKTKSNRMVFLIVSLVVMISFTGFLVGVSGQDASGTQPRESSTNAQQSRQPINQLAGSTPDSFVYTSQEDLREKKRESLEERAALRAFNGAPPVIPHSVDQLELSSCAACHREGLAAANFSIPRMSHKFLVNCLQCHAPPAQTWSEKHIEIENLFDGVEAPLEGERAWPGAPPTVPHSTQMRSNCISCHGPGGKKGLRTSHPERQNCLQCHAPSARLDQHQF